MECYADTPKGIAKDSPIEKALKDLHSNIDLLKETMVIFEKRLANVINQPEKPEPETTATLAGQSPLETQLVAMACSIAEIDRYLRQIQNRIQL